MRILCVLLPHFPLRCEIQRNPDIASQPAVVVQALGSQKSVLDYSPQLPGLQRDMPLQQALSRQGEARLIQADLPAYQTVFREVLDALEEKSPLVEGAELGTVYLGLGGLELLYPDDKTLVRHVREAIPRVFTAQIGIAEGKFPAYLAALYSPPESYRVLTAGIEDFLKGLACDVLPISLKSQSKLRDFGLRTLGQVTALPLGPLQAQFGPEGRKLRDLARGIDDSPLCPRLTEENIEESTVLPAATISLESLLVTVESLLGRVFPRLTPRGLGICSILLRTRTWNAEYWERHIQLKKPAMDGRSARPRIKQFLETFPQPGPVEQISLRVTGLGRTSGRQRSLLDDIRARDRLLEDIQQLEQRLGSPQIFKIKEVEPWSRIPERRYVLAPVSQ